eukprot:1161261-Pelagomonas_calceolata.AAC.3
MRSGAYVCISGKITICSNRQGGEQRRQQHQHQQQQQPPPPPPRELSHGLLQHAQATLAGMGKLTQEQLEALVQQHCTIRSAAKALKEGASTKGRGASKSASTSKRARTSKGARPRRGEHATEEEEGSE